MPRCSSAAPVLKWPGGKRQLLPQLRRFYPARVDLYIEPFLGSGAVFFDLVNRGVLQDAHARLSDDNADLIGTYLRLLDATDSVVSTLRTLAEEHGRNREEHYYRVRDERFNPARRRWRSAGANPADFDSTLAAMLIYLNRTGYNGLFRLNASGDFNVPAGRYRAPRILIENRIRAAAAVLASPSVRVWHAGFEDALVRAPREALVYLDPPYAPLNTTSNFRAYTSKGFGDADQRRLRDLVFELAARGATIVLSNSTAGSITSLYDTPRARRLGLRCWRVPARRAINSRAERRGVIDELIVSNRPPAD